MYRLKSAQDSTNPLGFDSKHKIGEVYMLVLLKIVESD
ncbi:hypothetical protein HJ01_02249 [Flavobacterium frigoris PS1]|uniref:Uncharacterized protein n=1 Tax=Flavobacterium frigoris (strain PS1) TaxID=1086011 RepID=H7FTP8_FLAFP|nr:hypothetical protein HJ01_02249 [Flavobacterium frigoris PS1]